MGWMSTAYTGQCLKSFSIFSWKNLTHFSGIFPRHEGRLVSPFFITSGAQIQNKVLLCLRESSSSCPSQRHGSLDAYKNQLVPNDYAFITLDMEKDTWRELPGILASLFFGVFLGTVPGTCHFSPWSWREIHQFPDQSGFALPRGGKEERVAAALLFDLSLDLLLISTLQESSKGNLTPLDANGEQKHKPAQTKILTHSVSLSGQPAL